MNVPFRWSVSDGTGDYLNLVLEPSPDDHNVQQQIDASGFIPQILILSEERDPSKESAGVSTALFLIRGGEEPIEFQTTTYLRMTEEIKPTLLSQPKLCKHQQRPPNSKSYNFTLLIQSQVTL